MSKTNQGYKTENTDMYFSYVKKKNSQQFFLHSIHYMIFDIFDSNTQASITCMNSNITLLTPICLVDINDTDLNLYTPSYTEL